MSNLQNKRLNESLKLLATTLNNLGMLGSISGAIVPYILGSTNPAWLWLPAWAILHFVSYLIIGFLQSED